MVHLSKIYQTLEDRGNYEEIKAHGPYFCSIYDSNGKLKQGTKEPWLGEGYYFWDTRINDAHWWGKQIYRWAGYVICESQYDQNSGLLYDLLGKLDLFDDFIKCAHFIKQQRNIDKVSFPLVLEYLKTKTDFPYKAIRVWPDPTLQGIDTKSGIFFPGEKANLRSIEKVQICFFDSTLLSYPYTIAAVASAKNFTI